MQWRNQQTVDAIAWHIDNDLSFSMNSLAVLVGQSENSVRGTLSRNMDLYGGILDELRVKCNLSQQEVADIISPTLTAKQIASYAGCTLNHVYKIAVKFNKKYKGAWE